MSSLPTAAKNVVQQLLGAVGYAIVKRQSLDQLSSQGKDMEILVREGDETTAVPKATLDMLKRESLLLREKAAEIATLRRQMEIIRANQGDVARAASARPEQKPSGSLYTPVFHFDGLSTDPEIIHNHDFMKDPRFIGAYLRAIKAVGVDYHSYWRVHVALWCASHALSLPGDFVECGVWRGLLSTAIMHYHNWNNLERRFVLFDTFRGFDEKQVTDEEIAKGNIAHFRQHYQQDIYQDVVDNFAEFKNVEIVRGPVPDSLPSKAIDRVCYLSIDMNNATPEIAAGKYFWDRLVPGAPILLDDYGFVTYEVQKRAWDAFAAERGTLVLALPTGQGLMLKPGADR